MRDYATIVFVAPSHSWGGNQKVRLSMLASFREQEPDKQEGRTDLNARESSWIPLSDSGALPWPPKRHGALPLAR